MGTWAQLSLQATSSPGLDLGLMQASQRLTDRRGTPGLRGSSEEERRAGMSPSSWGSQGRRHSPPEPFWGHRREGLSAAGQEQASRGTGRPCVVTLMRPPGRRPGGSRSGLAWLPARQHCQAASGVRGRERSPQVLRQALRGRVCRHRAPSGWRQGADSLGSGGRAAP